MKTLIDIMLPQEVMATLPSDTPGMVKALSDHFQKVIDVYESGFQQRVSGLMAGPLTKVERSILMDFLIDTALPEALQQKLRSAT